MRGFADKLFVGTGSTRGDLPPEVPPYSPSTTYVYLMAMRNLKSTLWGRDEGDDHRILCAVHERTRNRQIRIHRPPLRIVGFL